MPSSIAPTAPRIDAVQRKLIVGIVIAALLTLAIVTVDLAIGGRPDPPDVRAAATLLDGAWRFRVGDEARWADTAFYDGDWETIDLTAKPGSHDGDVGLPDYLDGWMARGHAGYQGYAWYRRAITVPTEPRSWVVLGPTRVEDGYELYWNGERLGGSGRLGAAPRVVGTRPLRFSLPADAAGTRSVLAVRAYLMPGFGRGATSGGLRTAPFLAPAAVGDALYRAQWQRTIAGYIADAIEPLAMLAVVGLALGYRARSTRRSFLIFLGIALLLSAMRRASNAIVSWTDLEDLGTYTWLAAVMGAPTIAAWTLAWNRWPSRPWKLIDAVAVVLGIAAIVATVIHSANLATASRWGSIALLVVIAARIVRGGPMRLLASLTLASIVLVLFGGELLDPIGVPGIGFPFGIGVSRTQVLYAIAIPLLACLIVRTLAFDQNPDRSRR
jgi:hypothetical protein